jgi:hypothetical protein
MEDSEKQPADPSAAWTDEDVFHARRRANFRSMLLAIAVGTAFVLFKIANYQQSKAGGTPAPQPNAQVGILEAVALGILVLVGVPLAFLTLSAWLDYVQRRGRRAPKPDDPI